ncbi:MAG: LytTR family DNA-binding domain-containing protein [Bacteroidota bacterium]
MNSRCIIVDDEPLAIKVIEGFLSNIKTFDIVATFTNPMDALEIIQSGDIDVVFLDINLPLINGMELIKTLHNPPLIVITTAYREYAVESFELDVLDYLVKPIPFNRFMKAVNKINSALSNKTGSIEDNRDHIFINIDKKMVKIYLDEILYVESLKDYIKINTSTGKHVVHQTLTSFTDMLPPETFIRTHRSFTISIPKVEAVVGNTVEIEGNQIPIGRNYVQEVKGIILS